MLNAYGRGSLADAECVWKESLSRCYMRMEGAPVTDTRECFAFAKFKRPFLVWSGPLGGETFTFCLLRQFTKIW